MCIRLVEKVRPLFLLYKGDVMKSMRVPVLVFENSEDVDILIAALYNWNETQSKYSKSKVQERLNEVYKIQTIFEKTNHN